MSDQCEKRVWDAGDMTSCARPLPCMKHETDIPKLRAELVRLQAGWDAELKARNLVIEALKQSDLQLDEYKRVVLSKCICAEDATIQAGPHREGCYYKNLVNRIEGMQNTNDMRQCNCVAQRVGGDRHHNECTYWDNRKR